MPWRVLSIANHSVGAIWLDSAHGKRPQLGNRRQSNSPCPVPTVSGSVWAPLPPLHPATSSLAGLFGQTSSMRCPFQVAPRDLDEGNARGCQFVVNAGAIFNCLIAMFRGWLAWLENRPLHCRKLLWGSQVPGEGTGSPEDDEGSPGAVVRHCKLHQLGIHNQRTGNGQLIDQ